MDNATIYKKWLALERRSRRKITAREMNVLRQRTMRKLPIKELPIVVEAAELKAALKRCDIMAKDLLVGEIGIAGVEVRPKEQKIELTTFSPEVGVHYVEDVNVCGCFEGSFDPRSLEPKQSAKLLPLKKEVVEINVRRGDSFRVGPVSLLGLESVTHKGPTRSNHQGKNTIRVEAEKLSRIAKFIGESISRDEGRSNITRALLHYVPDRLKWISTDGHRLHYAELEADLGTEESYHFLPKKVVDQLTHAVIKLDDFVLLLLDKKDATGDIDSFGGTKDGVSQSEFVGWNWNLISRVSDYPQYPPYTKVLPTAESDFTVEFDSGELLKALEVTKLAWGKSLRHQCNFELLDGEVYLRATDREGEVTEIKLSANYYGSTGSLPGAGAAFNGGYLTNAVKLLVSKRVRWDCYFTGEKKGETGSHVQPWRAVGPDADLGMVAYIMPMRKGQK